MTSTSLRKLSLDAGGYFGPASGLGALDYGHLGPMRRILRPLVQLPLRLQAPFLWELHLTSMRDLADLRVTLAGGLDAEGRLSVRAGNRAELIGVAAAEPADRPRGLAFRLNPADLDATLLFLGVTVLPLRPALALSPVQALAV